ncbi:hypothetical protein CRENBAI_025094 [Crenichthys baileyi]|uniref:Uncharacterized protein n=1 Tax=Crenichthys baileyi TaxID=28760 RepID=A0AAV9QZ73_9TELE
MSLGVNSLIQATVSIKDDGLYRCDLGFNRDSVGHAINISVSDLNEGVENSDNFEVDSNTPGDEDSWLPYFMICISIVLPVATVIVLTLVCFHGWKGTWSSNNKEQEIFWQIQARTLAPWWYHNPAKFEKF